ncbi:helix-turn-helix domain-containing protein [Paenibacillus hamazuiensis]|uniref:helix-turn-helix domain-containing protein n=1 Tax=Paenibacillus hamazuiensis TaxID=2936508 RepID=UPI002010BF4E|nr:AraC family transcriptional regulator [Paenibacillus hamazuiensis]
MKKELDDQFSLPKYAETFKYRDDGRAVGNNVIETIKHYTENHYKDITLDKVAKVVHMNPNYVSTYFKEKTGENFSDYLLSIKMKKAADLLGDVRLKTYEVSQMIGYSNTKNFTRTFKKFFGVSPREYRNKRGMNDV